LTSLDTYIKDIQSGVIPSCIHTRNAVLRFLKDRQRKDLDFRQDKVQKVIDLILKSVKAIYNQEEYWAAADQTKEELEEFIYSLTKDQFDKLEQFFVTSPKVVQVIECDCPKCGKHNISKLEGLQNFFV
jgi:glycosylphosphatidylinositol transamidase (GPIT) subunit GPI8